MTIRENIGIAILFAAIASPAVYDSIDPVRAYFASPAADRYTAAERDCINRIPSRSAELDTVNAAQLGRMSAYRGDAAALPAYLTSLDESRGKASEAAFRAHCADRFFCLPNRSRAEQAAEVNLCLAVFLDQG
jgi:hypothetical protein